ncbi:hypothetical protein AB6A40_000475 [Gnathostoma spinigerum]|uniref:Ubiquitin carboxyl-terminal hydrolase n=1 Tax=Gnathostoma spinigerum TaxID=75299 RepID=A0ABD6E8T4_9BILA
MNVDEESESPLDTCIVSLDSLKHEYYNKEYDTVVRLLQKGIQVEAVTFHDRSLQIDFHCLNANDPLPRKYGVSISTLFVWHAELAEEIIPEECRVMSGGKEFVLRRRDSSSHSLDLLKSPSSSYIPSSYATLRPHNSPRLSTSYRYVPTTSAAGWSPAGLPPSGYQRSPYRATARPKYSPQSYSHSSAPFSPSLSSSLRSRSFSSLSNRSSSPSIPTSTSPSGRLTAEDDFSTRGTYTARSPTSFPCSKPTAKVFPYEEEGTVVVPGFTGLRNIGNTCFMNATLQMLVNCKVLQVFFTKNCYKKDVNRTNPLGFRGRLADVFAEFMKQMWSGMNRVYEPTKVKDLVSEKASQFANFAQHDAHEFLSFLLDGLHEDLNRVISKPCTSTVEAAGRPDIAVANEAWRNHLLRNDSIFVDLFHGQLKSKLQCPKCDRISITFDPFVYLAVPFPKEKRSSTVYFWPIAPCLRPVKVVIRYSMDSTVMEMLTVLSELVDVPVKLLRMIEVSGHRISHVFHSTEKTSQISSRDTIYVFQVHDPADFNEPIVEFFVIQRLLYRKGLLRACANCNTSEGKLKTCERCYDILYCKRECQIEHWGKVHKEKCRTRSEAEPVGQPFMISLPQSKVTYATIMRNLEARCRYSVNVFQLPVGVETGDCLNNNISNCSTSSPRNKTVDAVPSTSALSVNTDNGNEEPEQFVPKASVRRQMVLGEPRNKEFTDSKLFIVRKLLHPDNVIGDTLSSKGEFPKMASGTYLSINWYNMKGGKDYITVDTKELEVDEEQSRVLSSKSNTAQRTISSASQPCIYDMLAMFSETERLKPEESWYCNKCKEHVEATKRLILYRLPPILIIQLKRFVYTNSIVSIHRRSKDERSVRYPIDGLDLADYLSKTAPKGQETKYDLFGVVCHSGSSYFGHYISFGRLQSLDGQTTEIDWRTFDDSSVTRMSSARVQTDDAYLLFYRQRGSVTKKILYQTYGVCE